MAFLPLKMHVSSSNGCILSLRSAALVKRGQLRRKALPKMDQMKFDRATTALSNFIEAHFSSAEQTP